MSYDELVSSNWQDVIYTYITEGAIVLPSPDDYFETDGTWDSDRFWAAVYDVADLFMFDHTYELYENGGLQALGISNPAELSGHRYILNAEINPVYDSAPYAALMPEFAPSNTDIATTSGYIRQGSSVFDEANRAAYRAEAMFGILMHNNPQTLSQLVD